MLIWHVRCRVLCMVYTIWHMMFCLCACMNVSVCVSISPACKHVSVCGSISPTNRALSAVQTVHFAVFNNLHNISHTWYFVYIISYTNHLPTLSSARYKRCTLLSLTTAAGLKTSWEKFSKVKCPPCVSEMERPQDVGVRSIVLRRLIGSTVQMFPMVFYASPTTIHHHTNASQLPSQVQIRPRSIYSCGFFGLFYGPGENP